MACALNCSSIVLIIFRPQFSNEPIKSRSRHVKADLPVCYLFSGSYLLEIYETPCIDRSLCPIFICTVLARGYFLVVVVQEYWFNIHVTSIKSKFSFLAYCDRVTWKLAWLVARRCSLWMCIFRACYTVSHCLAMMIEQVSTTCCALFFRLHFAYYANWLTVWFQNGKGVWKLLDLLKYLAFSFWVGSSDCIFFFKFHCVAFWICVWIERFLYT